MDENLFVVAQRAADAWADARDALAADPLNEVLLAQAEQAENAYLAAQAHAHASLGADEQDGSTRA